jgi:hypothetical protein
MRERLRAALELGVLRAVLPPLFARSSLDGLLARLSRRRGRAPGDLEVLEGDVRFAEALLSRVPGLHDTCLYRALGRYALLERRGHAPRFVLGIDARGIEVPGHAWVEVGDRPFAEPDGVARYRVTFCYPSPPFGANLGA